MEGEESNQQVTNSNEELVIAPENNGEVVAVGGRKRKCDEMASEGKDVLKACRLPINIIKIGQWKNEPKRHNEELIFRCYFNCKKSKFAWEALTETKKLRVEYGWDIIQAIQFTELTNINGGKLEILLKSTHTPSFFFEKGLEPNKHSVYESCEDFTKLDPKARREGVHDLYFELKHFKNLHTRILAAADKLAAKNLMCLKNLIVAPLELEASPSVQDQVPLPNGNHNVNSTCEPQLQQQIAHQPQVQRHYNDTRESCLRSVSYVEHHPLPPNPPSCSQVHYSGMISPPISGVSHFPTQRVVGNVFNNGITGNGSLNQLQLTHQQPSLPLAGYGSPSSPPYPNQYDKCTTMFQNYCAPLSANGPPTNGGGAELVTTDPDQNQGMLLPASEREINQFCFEHMAAYLMAADIIDNSISPPNDGGAGLCANIDSSSTSPPTDGSGACLYANTDSSTSPPTDRSGAELAPNGAHQSHQNSQAAVRMNGMKNQGGDGDLYSIINYPVIQKSR